MSKRFDALMAATNIDQQDPYGLVTAEMFTNPHPLYHMLRYSEPVHWSAILNAWVVTRYDDVVAALKDRRFSNAARRAVGTAMMPPEIRAKMEPIDSFLKLWTLNLDDPEHHALRVLLSKAFTPRAMSAMRPRIEDTCDELLDTIASQHRADYVREVAHPLPVRMIGEIFGVPEEGRQRLAGWSAHISAFFEFGPGKPEILDNMVLAIRELTDYLRAVVAEHRRQPQDNILGALIRAEEEGRFLNEEQLLATCGMILFAGHDSTVNLLSNGMLLLLQHPEQLELLRRKPELVRTAVDEFLRYEPPVMRHDRALLEDVEIDGHTLKRGQRVILGIGAANRDPSRFPDPDRFDITRVNNNRHLTFGYGAHACLGAALSCAQAEILTLKMLYRFPNIQLASTPYIWRQHFNFRGLRRLVLEY
jgi:cytochrome P450